jgi:S1-C subfamily serine protease
MKPTNYRFLVLVLFSVYILSACGTKSVIKNVEDRDVKQLQGNEKSKPIQFSKVVIKLKRGEHVGQFQAGVLCLGRGDIYWKGGRLTVDSEEFTDTFKDELEKNGFKTVGDANALFDDASTWKSEVLVAGLVKDLRVNICYPMTGFSDPSSSKGEAFLKVDWQIYSKLDRSVVYSVSSEGSGKQNESMVGGDNMAVLNAFSQATRNLLADEEFRSIVERGGKTVKDTTYKAGESIVLATASAKPVGTSPKEWTDAVVTVFAGRGHGSGFVVSDNLIMTNHHVVGDSNSVVIKFSTGLQIIGRVVASNSGRDVALVRIDGTFPKYLKLGRTLPAVGSEVYAIGSPLDEKYSATISKGIVSGIRDSDDKKFIQSDVNIQPGNSGGPLIGSDGAVVGITVSGLFKGGSSTGINFFIPIDDALKVMGSQ